MKRAALALLWTFAFWYLGSTLAMFLGISGPVGPILGIAAGAIAALDPRRAIWNHPPVVVVAGAVDTSAAQLT